MPNVSQGMPILFRIIAIIMTFTLLRTITVVWKYSIGDWTSWLGAGSYGWATLAMIILWLFLAPFAIVQLWRSKEIGRRTSVLLNLSLPGFYIYFWVNATVYMWFLILSGLAFALLLLSPLAKRACQRSWTERQILNLLFQD